MNGKRFFIRTIRIRGLVISLVRNDWLCNLYVKESRKPVSVSFDRIGNQFWFTARVRSIFRNVDRLA